MLNRLIKKLLVYAFGVVLAVIVGYLAYNIVLYGMASVLNGLSHDWAAKNHIQQPKEGGRLLRGQN